MSATLFAMGCWLVCIRSERCGGAEMTMWRDEAEAVGVAPSNRRRSCGRAPATIGALCGPCWWRRQRAVKAALERLTPRGDHHDR
jgi:hypothetical protein